MKIQCPQCGETIAPEQINVETDVAMCLPCNEAFRVSECFDEFEINDDVLSKPPSGTWFEETYDGFVLGATTRSFSALFLVPFTCVWSGLSMGGIYGSQIMSGQFDLKKSLFGIPFLLGSILLGMLVLMTCFGKVEVRVTGREGYVFTGVGPIGWKRRFNWSEVRSVNTQATSYQYAGGSGTCIKIESDRVIKFASGINDNRRYYMVNKLKSMQYSR